MTSPLLAGLAAAPFGELAKLRNIATRKAFHGTPHDFDEFDIAKIGTGEGAQAYGHGLYFTSKEEIAKFYRDSLTPSTPVKVWGIPSLQLSPGQLEPHLDRLGLEHVHPTRAKDAINRVRKTGGVDEALREIDALEPSLSDAFPREASNLAREREFLVAARRDFEVGEKPSGRLMTVEIPDESNMLDWDKPLGMEEAASIEAAIKSSYDIRPVKVGDDAYALASIDEHGVGHQLSGIGFAGKTASEAESAIRRALVGMPGDSVYRDLSRWFGGDEAASRVLSQGGIPGITYKGDTSGERNFVVFDDELINLVEKGQADPKLLALIAGGTGAAAAANQLGASDYAAAIGHGAASMGRGLVEDALRAGGYMNALIGAQTPEEVEAKAQSVMGLIPQIIPDPSARTQRAQENIIEGVADHFQGDGSFSALINMATPYYNQLPPAIRGLIESL